MSAAASVGGASLAGVADTSIFGASISGRFLGHATCQPHRGRTLAADRLPLNASQRVSHNIMDADAPRSGKV